MKKKRGLVITLIVIVVVMAGLLIADVVVYPLRSTILDLVGMDEQEITAVEISHHGERISVESSEQIHKILHGCEGEVLRKHNDYFNHYDTGGWSIRFIDESGTPSEWISSIGGTLFQYRHYFYAFAETDTQKQNVIFEVWDEMNP